MGSSTTASTSEAIDVSLVLPHLTYCSSIWDPPPSSINAKSLEKVQFFALKMCSHCWDSNYIFLLSSFQVPSLSSLRSQHKLLLLFKFFDKIIYLLSGTFTPALTSSHSSRYYHPTNLLIPYCRTSTVYNSFFPSAARLWNSLPPDVKSINSLSRFKFKVRQIYRDFI